MRTRRAEPAGLFTRLEEWIARDGGSRRLAQLLAAGVSRRQVGGALAAVFASTGLTRTGAAKKKKRKQRKKKPQSPGGGGCTTPGAPESLVCLQEHAACGGAHQCCRCRFDTSDLLVCLLVAVPIPPDGNDPSNPCQGNADCAAGWRCSPASHTCLPLCVH